MRKLYIIKARKCGDGCRQYTRQDTGCFVNAEDIRVLREPPRIIERVYDRELEQDEFFYSHDDIPPEANALLFDRRLERESSIIHAASYVHLSSIIHAASYVHLSSIIHAASYVHLKRVEDFCGLKNGKPCEMERMRREASS
jgi:hypothetical protein